MHGARENAVLAAAEKCDELGLDYIGLSDDDWEGEGMFLDGVESGDTETFSERVHIEERLIQ